MRINYLSDRWPWFGEHSGYDLVTNYIRKKNPDISIINTKRGFLQRCVGKCYSIYKRWPQRNQSYTSSELHFYKHIKGKLNNKNELAHVLFYDTHYFFFERWKKAPKNLTATIHHPPPRKMDERMKNNLKMLSSAIVLSSKDLDFYEKYIGKGKAKFIPHGVDTDFFKPAKREIDSEKHLLFVGQNGRNTKMLFRIITKIAKKHPKLKFDMLVIKGKRDIEGLRQLNKHPSIVWHENLFDNDLLKLYQNSYLLLMPLEHCAANNAVVEALACGLPIVTTNVGGIRDYGGSSVFPVIQNNDDKTMIELIEKYISDKRFHKKISKKQRDFAEKKLDWPLIAEEHINFYKNIIK